MSASLLKIPWASMVHAGRLVPSRRLIAGILDRCAKHPTSSLVQSFRRKVHFAVFIGKIAHADKGSCYWPKAYCHQTPNSCRQIQNLTRIDCMSHYFARWFRAGVAFLIAASSASAQDNDGVPLEKYASSEQFPVTKPGVGRYCLNHHLG